MDIMAANIWVNSVMRKNWSDSDEDPDLAIIPSGQIQEKKCGLHLVFNQAQVRPNSRDVA